MCVCVCVCVCIPYDWLNKLYSFNVAAVVCIISRCGLSTEAGHENQPNKHKLALYKLSIHFNSSIKRMHISSKTENFSYKRWVWHDVY